MIYICQTKNAMTTAYYYQLIEKACSELSSDKPIVLNDITTIKTLKPNRKTDLIFVGHITDAFYLLVRGYKKIAVWYQGIVPEERKMQGASRFKIFAATLLERFVCRRVQFSLFVSAALKEHFELKYDASFNSNYYIMPCFNEPNVVEKNFIKPQGKTVFAYAGGLGVWQCIEQTLEIYKKIEDLEENTELRFYTNQVDAAKRIISDHNLKRFLCKYVEPEALSEALADVKYGFVLREKDPVNKVSTPTKFSTYLANGVMPVYSSAIEGFSSAMGNSRYQIRLENLDIDNSVNIILKHMREDYNPKDILDEYKLVFNDYYSTEKHIINLSHKLKTIYEE